MNNKFDTEIQGETPSDRASALDTAIALRIQTEVGRLNRGITMVATGLLGIVILAATVLAFLGHHPRAVKLPKGPKRTVASFYRVPIR